MCTILFNISTHKFRTTNQSLKISNNYLEFILKLVVQLDSAIEDGNSDGQ